MLRIAVTGSSGFIGSWLCRLLEIPEERRWTRAKGASYDVGTEEGKRRIVASCDVIVHLAGISGIKNCEENPKEASRVNGEVTIQLAQSAKQAGVRRFIFASTSAVYGESQASVIDENHPVNPKTLYGKTKLQGETVLSLADRKFEVIVLRKSNIYGKGLFSKGTNAVDNLLERYLGRQAMELTGDGTQKRDFVHLTDVARVYARLAQAPDQGEGGIFNLGGPEEISIGNLAEKINEIGNRLFDYRVPIKRSGEKSGVSWSNVRFDWSKARRVLGYEPLFGLEDYIKERLLEEIRSRR